MSNPAGSSRPGLLISVKRFAKAALRMYGYEVRRMQEIPPRVPSIRHSDILPLATYSPWLADEEFTRTYEVVRDNTLVDRYRCYELWHLVAEASKLPEGDFIEIGVWRGGTGALIGKRCQLLGLQSMLYLCDTFRGVVKAGSKDTIYAGGEHADTTKAAVSGLCASIGLERVHILEGVFPEDSGECVRDRRFRFCHIDVDAYQSAKDIVEWMWPRLVPGGIVVYDDYGFYSCSGITQFVNQEGSKRDRMLIHNLNGHAVVIKIAEHESLAETVYAERRGISVRAKK
jgi:O-methyltransferase